jgi:hypothetical protein
MVGPDDLNGRLETRLPISLLADFQRVAEQADRTVSQELRRLIRQRVAESALNGRDPVTTTGSSTKTSSNTATSNALEA